MNTETALFKLDTAQAARKAELEKIIGDGIQTFRAVGEALAEVRAAKLYADEFETFEEYVKEKWQIGQARAYQLMNAANVAKTVLPVVEIPNERVARQLSTLSKPDQIRAAKVLAKTPQNITAATAREAVRKVAPRGGLAAMAAAAKSGSCEIAQVGKQGEMPLNLNPAMTPIAKAKVVAAIDEWYQANYRQLNSPPAATPETMVRRIKALFK